MGRTPWGQVLARCAVGQEAADDGELLQRFAHRRDQAAFELLLWRHGGRVLRLCQGILHDAQEAEDAFQATFLVLARKAGTVAKHVSIGSWLYKVAYRLALRARRMRQRLPQGDWLAALAEPAAEDTSELRDVVHDEVLKLPEKYRAAVALCYLAGLSTAQAAEQLGCPRGTVLSRLAGARRRLRARLTRRGFAVTASVLAVLNQPHLAPAAAPTQVLVQATCQAARLVAVGTWTARGLAPHASPRAVELMEGAMNVMLLGKVKWALALAALVLVSAGVGAWMQQPGPGKPTQAGIPLLEKIIPLAATQEPVRVPQELPPAVRFPGPVTQVSGSSLPTALPPPAPMSATTMIAIPADGSTIVITRPTGEWERIIDVGPVTGTITMRFEGTNRLSMAIRIKADSSLMTLVAQEFDGKLPPLGALEVGIKLSAEYSMASDGLLYGIFTGCELETEALRKLNMPAEVMMGMHAGLAAAEAAGGLLIDQPFSMRFRQDGGALTVKDLKFLGLDLMANFMPGGPAAYQAAVTGRFKRKTDAAPAVQQRPLPIQQASHVAERPMTDGANSPGEEAFRQAVHYQSQGDRANAYFHFELLRRRYPGTRYATEAETRMKQMMNEISPR